MAPAVAQLLAALPLQVAARPPNPARLALRLLAQVPAVALDVAPVALAAPVAAVAAADVAAARKSGSLPVRSKIAVQV